MELKENERIDDLEYKGLKIIQNTNYFCFGIDSILLKQLLVKYYSTNEFININSYISNMLLHFYWWYFEF